MKLRYSKVVLGMILCLGMFSLTGCGNKEMSSVSRDVETADSSVYFDDEAVALAGSVENATMTDAEKARAKELKAMATKAFDLINAKRAEKGLAALVWNNDLELCAQVRATECNTKFSHTRPDGTDWWTVNSKVMWGENLAKGYTTAEDLVNAWMNSPTHAANIVKKEYVTCALAVYEMDGKIYVAQEFGY